MTTSVLLEAITARSYLQNASVTQLKIGGMAFMENTHQRSRLFDHIDTNKITDLKTEDGLLD
jgi:hypothetical protein